MLSGLCHGFPSYLLVTALILFGQFYASQCTLTVLWPPYLAGFQCESAQLYYGGIQTNFAPINNTKLVFPGGGSVQGYLAFSQAVLPTQPTIRSFMEQGAIGVVFQASSAVPGRLMFSTDGSNDSDITIPVVQLGPLSVYDVFQNFNGSYMIVNLTSDGNEWRDVYQSPAMIFLQAFVTATGVVVAALALWKAILFLRYHRFQYPIPLLCQLLDFLACLERSVYFAIDPRNIHKIFEKNLELVLFYINIPFTLAVVLLITFFWHDALVEQSVRVHSNISKLKVPFLITIDLLFLIELLQILLSILLYESYDEVIYIVNTFVLMIFSLACAIYYLVIARRVLRRLKQSSLRDNKPAKKLTGLVIASSVGLFFFAALNMVGLVEPIVDDPYGYVFWFCTLYVSLNYIAITHVLSFHPTKTAKAKSHPSTEVKTETIKSEAIASVEKSEQLNDNEEESNED